MSPSLRARMKRLNQESVLSAAGARPVKRTIQRELESALAKVRRCCVNVAQVSCCWHGLYYLLPFCACPMQRCQQTGAC